MNSREYFPLTHAHKNDQIYFYSVRLNGIELKRKSKSNRSEIKFSREKRGTSGNGGSRSSLANRTNALKYSVGVVALGFGAIKDNGRVGGLDGRALARSSGSWPYPKINTL